MQSLIQIHTTFPTSADAERVAAALIERRLAACVQISGPITSIYRWHGAVERSAEWSCAIKTLAGNVPRVSAAILELHPYECPEIIATPITEASPSYDAWLRDQIESE